MARASRREMVNELVGSAHIFSSVVEELMAERALQQGDAFTVGGFFDDFFAAGVIPTVLTRWELTGEKDPILDPSR